MDLVGAIGPVASFVMTLSLIALNAYNIYVLFIRPRRARPRFKIELGTGAPFFRETLSIKFQSTDPNVTTPTYWVRVRIGNAGKSAARGCLGQLREIMDSEGKPMEDFDPTRLHWVTTDWSKAPFDKVDLGRGDYEYLDLLATQANDDKAYICGDQFEWAGYTPRGIKRFFEPGEYVLRLVIYGDNVEPVTKYLSLAWLGMAIENIFVEMHDSLDEARACLKQKACWLVS
jgi:hypothetical protein